MPGTKSTPTPVIPAPIPVKPGTASTTKLMPLTPEASPKQAKPRQRGKPSRLRFLYYDDLPGQRSDQTATQIDTFAAPF
jgi:hypothetical protein